MKLFLDWRAMAVGGAVAAGAAFAISPGAGIGMALGLLGTAFGFFVTWLGLTLLAKAAEGGAGSSLGSSFTVVLFLLKLPILISLWIVARQVDPAAPPSFLVGLGLVYCWAVTWAQAKQSVGPDQ